ncbi:unnamed protein product [Urochloa decumbens]|uniref:Uncharacterized protein n=1 Tax=Urochloa decumbens TaxID=240449 RepID=A0ABC9C3L7_9POAL
MAVAEVVLEVLPPPPREPAAAVRHFTVPKVVMYLYFASAWVGCACLAAGAVVARRALGVDSPVTYAFIKASLGSFVFPALVIAIVTLRLLRAMCAAGFKPSLRTSAREIQIQWKMFGGLTWKVLRHPAVLVGLAYFFLFLLLGAGALMLWGLLPVEKSQREKIGYALLDTGVLGTMAICCFVIIPNYALKVWRSK